MKTVISFMLSLLFGFRALGASFPLTMENYSNNILAILGFWVLTLLLAAFTWNSYKEASIATEEAHEKNKLEKELKEERNKITAESTHDAFPMKYLGGSGYEFTSNSNYYFAIMKNEIRFISEKNHVNTIKFNDVLSIDIGGPGKTTTNAGISGGGFGLEGFIKGAVTAAVINKITSSSSINTFLKILTKNGEIYLHTSAFEPDQLRIMLSTLSVQIANRKPNNLIGIADELVKLNELMQAGTITKEDFETAKNKILQ